MHSQNPQESTDVFPTYVIMKTPYICPIIRNQDTNRNAIPACAGTPGDRKHVSLHLIVQDIQHLQCTHEIPIDQYILTTIVYTLNKTQPIHNIPESTRFLASYPEAHILETPRIHTPT